MLHVPLSPTDHEAVQTLRRDPTLTPTERDRVEMICLSAAGWGPPQIAPYLGSCTTTVRRVLHRFAASGPTSLRRRHLGPAPDLARRQQVETVIDRLLGADRTGTATQVAEALGEVGIALSPRQTRKYLRRMDARWRRSVHSLVHKQDLA